MIKSTSVVVLCVLVAVSSAQTNQLIPFVSNMVKGGCPQMCAALDAFCKISPLKTKCATYLKTCTTTCTTLQTCITKCGPNCDAFESNCVKSGIIYQPFAGIFCPVIGQTCDVTCVVTCPQNILLGIMQQILTQIGVTVQGFIGQFIPKLK